MTWLLAFLLTVAVEGVVVLALAPPPQRRRLAGDACLANLMTHPVAFWLVTNGHLGFWPTELLVCLAEAVVYHRVSRLGVARAAATSLAANGVTIALSFVW